MAQKLKALINRISGMKLRYRLLFIYIIGGAVPIIFIGLYLVHGMSNILIDQAKDAEIVELEMARRQVEEMTGTVSTVTKYFYFNPQLEEIAAKKYEDYQEVVQDYKEFTSFLDYGRYYNSTLAWINIYIKNDSIVGNSRFVKVTDKIEEEEWYQSANRKKGAGLWRFHQIPSADYKALTLFRMLKTQKGEDVGVLAVSIRPQRFTTLLQNKNGNAFILLNGETIVTDLGSEIEAGQLKDILPSGDSGQFQKNIILNRQEYVMTCETIPLIESQDYLQIVSLRAYREILRDVNSQTTKSMLFFVLSAIMSIIIILLFSHSFSRRVEWFLNQMQKAAGGSFELEEMPEGSDEISELYDYLGTMIYQIQRLLAEVYREKLHSERLTIQQKDAEFKMLASQINPHFLYNTLETIRMRARRSKQYDIEEIVKMLAKIMRSTLQAGANDVTIAQEAELVEHYLKIQQYRFGERIKYHIWIEDGLKECYILPLIMQPIVENSIIHGLESKEGAGCIDINIHSGEENVVIVIEDDGLGMSEEKLVGLQKKLNCYNEKGKHIGVSNVHQRVRLRYGDTCGVRIDSREGSFTRVEIRLPDAERLTHPVPGIDSLADKAGIWAADVNKLKGDTDVQGDDN